RAGASVFAAAGSRRLRVERRAHVESIVAEGGQLGVALGGDRRVVVDEIVALTGYRPDPTIAGELAVELSPASEGAGRLGRAIADVTDCLSVPAVSAAGLASGEPRLPVVRPQSYRPPRPLPPPT